MTNMQNLKIDPQVSTAENVFAPLTRGNLRIVIMGEIGGGKSRLALLIAKTISKLMTHAEIVVHEPDMPNDVILDYYSQAEEVLPKLTGVTKIDIHTGQVNRKGIPVFSQMKQYVKELVLTYL